MIWAVFAYGCNSAPGSLSVNVTRLIHRVLRDRGSYPHPIAVSELEDLASVLREEVLKRDVVEGEEAQEATARARKAMKRARKKS